MNNNLELIDRLSLGKEDIQNVTIVTDDDEELTVCLRPLTSGEITNLQKIENKPYRMKMKLNTDGKVEETEENVKSNQDVDLDMSELSGSQKEVMYYAVAWSMSSDGVTVHKKQVEKFRKGVPELIFTEVIRISTITEKDLKMIKTFRKL